MKIQIYITILLSFFVLEIQAQSIVNLQDFKAEFLNEDPKEIRKKARDGDVLYQVLYGDILRKGNENIAPNLKKAIKWYEKASEENEGLAFHRLAYLYENGLGVDTNLQLCLDNLKKSAEANYRFACLDFGKIHFDTIYKNLGISPDLKQAEFWFSKGEFLKDYRKILKTKFPSFYDLKAFCLLEKSFVENINFKADLTNYVAVKALNTQIQNQEKFLSKNLTYFYQSELKVDLMKNDFNQSKENFEDLSKFQNKLYSQNWLQPEAEQFKPGTHEAIKDVLNFDDAVQVKKYYDAVGKKSDSLANDLQKAYLKYRFFTTTTLKDLQDFQTTIYSRNWLQPEAQNYHQKTHDKIKKYFSFNDFEAVEKYYKSLKRFDKVLAQKYQKSYLEDRKAVFLAQVKKPESRSNALVNFIKLIENADWLIEEDLNYLPNAELAYLQEINFSDSLVLRRYFGFLKERNQLYNSPQFDEINSLVFSEIFRKTKSQAACFLMFDFMQQNHFFNLDSSYALKNLAIESLMEMDKNFLLSFDFTKYDDFNFYFDTLVLRNSVLKNHSKFNLLNDSLSFHLLNHAKNSEYNLVKIDNYWNQNKWFYAENPQHILDLELDFVALVNFEENSSFENYYENLAYRQQHYSSKELDFLAVELLETLIEKSNNLESNFALEKAIQNYRWFTNYTRNPELKNLEENFYLKKHEIAQKTCFKLIESANLTELKRLLNKGISINLELQNGFSLLGFATLKEANKIAKYLKLKGAELSEKDQRQLEALNQAKE